MGTITNFSKPNLGADKLTGKCPDSSSNLTAAFVTTGLTASWSIGGVAVTAPSTVSATGIYRLIVVNGSGCSDTALVTLSNDVQLCPQLVEKITISPNPVTDKLSISIAKRDAVKIEITVHNAFGQKMYSINSQQAAGMQLYTVPMKQMAAGIYYVNVFINGKEQAVKKILKQ